MLALVGLGRWHTAGARPGTHPDPHLVSRDSSVALTAVVSTQMGLTAHCILAIFCLLVKTKYLLSTLKLCMRSLSGSGCRCWIQQRWNGGCSVGYSCRATHAPGQAELLVVCLELPFLRWVLWAAEFCGCIPESEHFPGSWLSKKLI